MGVKLKRKPTKEGEGFIINFQKCVDFAAIQLLKSCKEKKTRKK